MTNQERQAERVGIRLAKALIAIEKYNGDPEDVLDEAAIALHSSDRSGARDALAALTAFYCNPS